MNTQQNQNNNKCEHVWIAVGLWDGKTPEGLRTGGKVFECIKCHERVNGEQKALDMGGTIDWENSRIKSPGK